MLRYTSSYGFCGMKHIPYYSESHVRPAGFGRDVILNAPFIADQETIGLRKQSIIDKSNQLEK